VLTGARPRRMWGVNYLPTGHLYAPMPARITSVVDETPDTKTFRIALENPEHARDFLWEPGQFVELSVFGVGEAPIGFASSPLDHDAFELTIVARGSVTRAVHALAAGDLVGIRGPHGNAWPLEAVRGSDVVIVAGGCGLAPLRPAIFYLLANRAAYGRLVLLYGARTPGDRDFKADLEHWAASGDLTVLQTVDSADASWHGEVGAVTTLFRKISVEPARGVAFTCGPPVMIHFVTLELGRLGFADDRIVTSLERHMRCGVGKCGHCCVNQLYLCVEGPVLTRAQIKRLAEARA